MFLCVFFTLRDDGFLQKSKHAAVKVVFDCLYSLSAVLIYHICLCQWPRGLKRGSAAVLLLGLQVRIPPGTWMSVCCECRVLSGRFLYVGLITRPEECGVSECDREASITRRFWPTGVCCAMGEKV
jgi:hypothetical protein